MLNSQTQPMIECTEQQNYYACMKKSEAMSSDECHHMYTCVGVYVGFYMGM